MNVGVLVGNPKPASRTAGVGREVARRLSGQESVRVIDLAAETGPGLLTWGDPDVERLITEVQGAELLIVASPTFKATYTGLLKLFLDQVPTGSLDAVTAIPVMVGGSPSHALAAELHLKPLLVELGARCPTPALYVLEDDCEALTVLDGWLALALRQVRSDVRRRP